MYYGHGSWIALAVFGAMFALRALSSQRRRRGHPRGPGPGSSLTDHPRQEAPGPPVDGANTGQTTTSGGTPPGWFADPFFRHGHRYWSGSEWTEHVNDDGVPGTDPPPGRKDGGPS